MPQTPRPMLLTILDGWGYSEDPRDNAILAADTPVWDRMWRQYPHTLVNGSGHEVGLPEGQMGNSEVGHLNLGAGRIVYQDYTRITLAIEDGSFYSNPVLTAAVEAARSEGGKVHVIGLLSPGGVHSHESHIHAMVRLAAQQGAREVCVHAILDGRDTPPRSAEPSLARLDALYEELGCGRTASIVGRYFAMDRDNRWDRVQRAWHVMVDGRGEYRADSATAGLRSAYARGESDEFVKATAVGSITIDDGDAVVFMNFRADRARELTKAFIMDDFDGFERQRVPHLARFVALTEYQRDFGVPVAFPPVELHEVLGEYISQLGLKQLRIAETEKYAHVTFFFNGGEETPFPGEDRILIPSPRVATYDLQPEMSAPQVTDRLVEAIGSGRYDLIICNYANADMVGHTGDLQAAMKAVETLDHCMGRLEAAILKAGGEMLITADHGNAERMRDEDTGQAHTAHTTNLVPLVYVGKRAHFTGQGILSDVAPTLLRLMGLPQPAEMTGHPLVEFDGA